MAIEFRIQLKLLFDVQSLEKKKVEKIIRTGLSSKLSRVVPTKIDTAPQISSVTSSEIALMSNFPDVNLVKFIVRCFVYCLLFLVRLLFKIISLSTTYWWNYGQFVSGTQVEWQRMRFVTILTVQCNEKCSVQRP